MMQMSHPVPKGSPSHRQRDVGVTSSNTRWPGGHPYRQPDAQRGNKRVVSPFTLTKDGGFMARIAGRKRRHCSAMVDALSMDFYHTFTMYMQHHEPLSVPSIFRLLSLLLVTSLLLQHLKTSSPITSP